MNHKLLLVFVLILFACSKPVKEDLPTLTVYTYDAFSAKWGTAPKIKKIFEKKHNCKLKFVGIPSSIGALRKIELENKDTKADVLLGIDSQTVDIANKTALFAPHNLDESNLKLPFDFSDPNFTPFDYSYFAFVYDSSKLKNPPHSFEELANMPKNFKIAIQDPRSSTSGFGLLLWVKSIYKDKAKDYWKRLAPHILTVTKGWSESYNLFLKGEVDMVLSYTTSPAYHMIEEGRDDIKAAKFSEGHFAQIEVAGILKNSKKRALAREFLKFLHSKEFASIIPTANWAYPVIESSLPKEYDSLIRVDKTLTLDEKTVNQNRAKYISEWIEALKSK